MSSCEDPKRDRNPIRFRFQQRTELALGVAIFGIGGGWWHWTSESEWEEIPKNSMRL